MTNNRETSQSTLPCSDHQATIMYVSYFRDRYENSTIHFIMLLCDLKSREKVKGYVLPYNSDYLRNFGKSGYQIGNNNNDCLRFPQIYLQKQEYERTARH
ncbi:hypothetical protein LOAG_07471 [Loa loa]|uniref:Uncharacterized protein n=1 Tax=Loa loa TaxID=7209 RepID=A0A1S0TVZ2_LOALO|nr:hypothetical protein LOAG_07471 [Loa loa]EFO21021.1 hypothetical protein LOAG_07471 [Loa loa]